MRYSKPITMLSILLALLAGCDSGTAYQIDLSSDPSPITLGDAIYMISPLNQSVVKVMPGPQGESIEDFAYTDLEEAGVEDIFVGGGPGKLTLTPDRSLILTLSHHNNSHLLAIIDPDAVCGGEEPVDRGCVTQLEARPLHDSLVLSPDSRYAISYISTEAASNSTEDVINLNEVGIYDLREPSVLFASLGFNPKGFAFTHSPDDPRMVAITSTKVIALDLATGAATPKELTLGTESTQNPKEVVITGDDHFALVTIQGSADLFTFDLTEETLPINILSLSNKPGQMASSSAGDQTLILTSNRSELNVVHHEDLSIDVYSLSQPADTILVPPGATYAALYDAGQTGRYLYHFDTEIGRLQAYLLDNPCSEVKASPSGDALVIFYEPDWSGSADSSLDSSYAVAILNLAQGDRQPTPILVSSSPLDAVFVPGLDPSLDQVFVPFDGYEYGLVARFNLSTYDSDVVKTPPLPRDIDVLADGRIVVVHASPLGLITLFPSTTPDLIQFVSGFMTEEML